MFLFRILSSIISSISLHKNIFSLRSFVRRMSDEQTVNIPQLVAFLLISALAVRWFFFSSSSTSSSTSSESPQNRNAGGRRVDERQVEQIQAMFPQYGRRELIWDLMRNGGSVQATTERILGGRRLEVVSV